MNKPSYIIGVDLGGTKIYTALTKKNGKIVSEVSIPTQADRGKRVVLDNIFSSIDTCLHDAGISLHRVSDIGIGVPGQVDYKKGVIVYAPHLPGWRHVPIRSILKKKLRKNVHVANDAQLAALAETLYGAGKKARNLIYITISTGIGGGIIIDRKIYFGSNGTAGEIGHILLHSHNTLDTSAFHYSLEQLASGTSIRREFNFEAYEIEQRLSHRDPRAVKALKRIIHYIGLVLANLTTILNPDMIIIGGGLSNLGGILIDPLKKEVKKNAFSVSKKAVRVVRAQLRGRSGVLGAVALCREVR